MKSFYHILSFVLILSVAQCSTSSSETPVEDAPDCVATPTSEGCEALLNLGDTLDTDGDGVLDSIPDNCLSTSNADQANVDGDAFGDVCDDDSDADQKSNDDDNCIYVANIDQADADGDDEGDACDTDIDGDGVLDAAPDNCIYGVNSDQTDQDGDGLGDVCDDDLDGDGAEGNTGSDNCVYVSNADQADQDGDGIGDVCEDDTDGDGFANAEDACPTTPASDTYVVTETNTTTWTGCCYDTDADSICDHEEPAGCVDASNTDGGGDGIADCDTSGDTDGDGSPNSTDNDIDGDGLANDADLCPELASVWYIFQNTKIIDATDAACPDSDENGSYYWVEQTIYPGTTPYGGCDQNPIMRNEREVAAETQAAICVLTFGLAGYCDYQYQNTNFDNVVDQTKAQNYSDAALVNSDEVKEQDYTGDLIRSHFLGTWQKDADGDSIGDACDAQPTVYNRSFGTTMMTTRPF